jgi:hypothetical protein
VVVGIEQMTFGHSTMQPPSQAKPPTLIDGAAVRVLRQKLGSDRRQLEVEADGESHRPQHPQGVLHQPADLAQQKRGTRGPGEVVSCKRGPCSHAAPCGSMPAAMQQPCSSHAHPVLQDAAAQPQRAPLDVLDAADKVQHHAVAWAVVEGVHGEVAGDCEVCRRGGGDGGDAVG